MESELHRQNQKEVRKRFEDSGVPMSGGRKLQYRVSVDRDVTRLVLCCSPQHADRVIAVVRTAIAEDAA